MKSGGGGASFTAARVSLLKSAARENALFDRCFLQSRASGANRARIAASPIAFAARHRAARAFRCADGAPRTRFLKWNAAFFVVL
ncbi:MAG TPA: hypothetical protein VN655_09410 [Pseudolabrys sp.]|nr:hypothetical protein [Pseudolabrys sp.]